MQTCWGLPQQPSSTVNSKIVQYVVKHIRPLGITGGLVVVVGVLASLPSCKTLDHADLHIHTKPDPVPTPKE